MKDKKLLIVAGAGAISLIAIIPILQVFPIYIDILSNQGNPSQLIPFFSMLLPVLLGMYIFEALILYSIYKKAGHKNPWMAWIPLINVIPVLQLGKYSWAWLFILLLPFIGPIIFLIIYLRALSRVFRIAGYDKWLVLLMFLPIASVVMLAIVAWEKETYPNVE